MCVCVCVCACVRVSVKEREKMSDEMMGVCKRHFSDEEAPGGE